jgi:hypothetical protein
MNTKRKFFIALAAFLIPLAVIASTTEECQSLSDGLRCANKPTDRFSVHGATPVVQQAVTMTAFAVLQANGFIAAGQDYSLQHATVPLTAANLIAMYATPVSLIAAPGSGKSIVVQKLAFTIARSSTAFTSGGAVIIQYDTTTHGGGTQALDSTLASTVITGAAGTSVSARHGAVISDLASTSIQNLALTISNATGAFATGTGTATVDIWYYVY